MIRNLGEWSTDSRALIEESLNRRYLIRHIKGVNSVSLGHGFLNFEVLTDVGTERFTMRWTQSQAVDFGERGKIIVDSEDNRYVVPDIDSLPMKDRERFLQYVYW